MRTHAPDGRSDALREPGHQVAMLRDAAAGGRDMTRALVYELFVDCQMAWGGQVAATAWDLAEQARLHDWVDVRALASYTALYGHMLHDPHRPSIVRDGDAFVQWATAHDDPLAIALSLTARACTSIHLGRRHNQLDDLIAAYVAAEPIEARVERAFVVHEIAGNFHGMRLWELASELYDKVADLIAGVPAPRALTGSLAVNRVYTLACELLHATEAGDTAQARSRAARVAALTADHAGSEVPPEWRDEIDAYTAVCRMLVQHDQTTTDAVAALLERPPTGRVTHVQVSGLLRCLVGWHHIQQGRWHAATPVVLRGAQAILSGPDPAFRSFALWLRAVVANHTLDGEDRAALLDYRRALLAAADHSRDALIRSAQARLQTERLRVERDRFAQESLTDSLTGIANRRALEARLRGLSAPSTLIIVDIDRFKPVNDRFGHEVGDRVLRRIGQILRDCVRPGDLAARLGGDEFVLVLDTDDAEVATRRGHEVRDRVRSEPWHDIRRGLTVAASVGVACGQEGETALYRAADAALYEAKRAGGARVRALVGAAARPPAGV